MVEKIRKIRSRDFNITKVGNKSYGGIDHITGNVINIYSLFKVSTILEKHLTNKKH